MKKIFTFLAVSSFFGSVAFAQSQRFQIIEEFTGENCGPCAGTNPGFDAIWNAASNHSKATTIKYQGNIPSAGPVLYNQNTGDVTSRMTYYSVSSHPDMVQDGKYNAGHPGNFEQYMIDDREPVSSPFTYSVSHSFVGAAKDSIRVQASITCTQAVTYTVNKLKNHIVLIEKDITFETAPGTNGEKEFYNVIRKMFYGPAGKVIKNNWIVGDVINIDTTFVLPYKTTVTNKYTYDKTELAIVCFLQNDTDKEIQQGAISSTQRVDLDAAVKSLSTGASGTICATSASGSTITPSFVLENKGTTTITSVDVTLLLDNVFVSSFTWTGSLATDAVETVNLTSLTASSGSHRLTVKTGLVNGVQDQNIGYKGTYSVGIFNGEKSAKFSVLPFVAVALPIVQDFEGTTFPPTDWTLNNVDGDTYTWTRKTNAVSATATNAAAKMDFYNSPEGNVDELYLPKFDAPTPADITLKFKYAHIAYNGSINDNLKVKASSDCGVSWTTLWDASSNSGLSTATAATAAYTPSNASQWQEKTVELTQFSGSNGMFVKFEANSGYGNNLYIDDINLDFVSTVGITEKSAPSSAFAVVPNPVADKAQITFTAENSTTAKVSIVGILGNEVFAKSIDKTQIGTNVLDINTEGISNGVYFVNLQVGDKMLTKKVVVSK